MDNMQLHIWQLSEKTDSIDRDNDIVMIHDKYALKKTSLKNLFEYFNQNYKVESTVAYFENIINNFDEKYSVYYGNMEIELTKYEEIVDELSEKIIINENKIRSIETDINKLYSTIVAIDNNLKSVNSKEPVIFEALWRYSGNLINLSNQTTDMYNTLIDYSKHIEEAAKVYEHYKSNIENVYPEIDDIKNNINSNNNEKSKELLDLVNSEYDKILSIIDYYHHIHEQRLSENIILNI